MREHLNRATRLFPVVGDPVVHVMTPTRLTAKLVERGHDGICLPVHVAAGDLDGVMAAPRTTRNVDGLLVTMPHKNAAHAHCSTSSDASRLLGAVSVARRNGDGTWHGDTLDGIAFVSAMRERGARLEGSRVLQVGAGGVKGAIAVALLDAGVRELVLHDADAGRVGRLMGLLSGRGRVVVGPPDRTGCEVACNATPSGLSPGDAPPMPFDLLRPATFVGDVVAAGRPTPLVEAARAAGCRTSEGAQMVEAVLDIIADFLLGRGSQVPA